MDNGQGLVSIGAHEPVADSVFDGEDLILDAGAVYVNYGLPNQMLMGASLGGNVFTVDTEYDDELIDGAKGEVIGGRRILEVRASLVVNLIDVSSEFLSLATPGSGRETTQGYSTAILKRRPVSYWRLGEKSGSVAVDEMGLQNGTYHNVTLNQETPPQVGDGDSSAYFDGSGRSYVGIPHNAAHGGMDNLTIELLFKISEYPAYGKEYLLLQKWGPEGVRDDVYVIAVSGDKKIVAKVSSGPARVYIVATSTKDITLDEWHRVILRFYRAGAKSYLELYVDGVLFASGSSSAFTVSSKSIPIYIGGNYAPSFPQNTKGWIDEVAIYDYDWYTPGNEDLGLSDEDIFTRTAQIVTANYFENITLVAQVSGKDQPVICGITNAIADSDFDMETEDEAEAIIQIRFVGTYEPSELDSEPWFIRFPRE